jgi:alpha-beta hydrolase superfamily lysophospholipase
MSADTPVRSVYLTGTTGEPFLGLLHERPTEAKATRPVLICPPFGWEEICSYRARRAWAECLAREGRPTLRIDLPGSGDSGGEPDDDGRLQSWSDAIATAARWLAEEGEHSSVASIGIGLGGLALCMALADGAPVEEIVLWGTPSRGSRLVRELRAFARLESAQLALGDERAAPPPADGSVEAGGFRLSAQSTGALEALDVTELPLHAPHPRRALALGRDGLEADARLLEHLRTVGVEVTALAGPGYGAMMAEPQEARAPLEVFAAVGAWLRESPTEEGPPGESPPKAGPLEEPPLEEGHGATARRDGAGASSAIELELGGERVRERTLTVEQDFGRLFGILSTPASVAAAPLTAVILNAGAMRHTGPSRMWVEIARRWSARGVATLRLDLEGIGDADGDESRFSKVDELYVPGLVDQVLAALDVLERDGVGHRFVLLGLCSGAYWSFYGALQDERVVAAFMLNPQTLFFEASQETVRELRKVFLSRSSWLRLVRGDAKLTRLATLARKLPTDLATAVRRLLSRLGAPHEGADPLDRALAQLEQADKRVLFVFSGEELLHQELERAGRMDRLEAQPHVRVELIAGKDHTLRPSASRVEAHAALDRALERELERERGHAARGS